MTIDGIVVVDKPPGMTSHDVVDELRRRFRTKRVGHGGTLDPDATGVLIVGLGKATRFLDYGQQSPKRYRAVVRLGSETTTQDSSGEVVSTSPVDATDEDIARALGRFRGEIEQLPPMVSAVKVGGERLYRKARRGEEIDRRPRRVTIYELRALGVADDEVTLDVLCSAGTYIRTLAHDLGRELGCGAHLASLCRTESGGFSVDAAVALEDVDERSVRPVIDAVQVLPALELPEAVAAAVRNGRAIQRDAADVGGDLVAMASDGKLLAVYRRQGDRLIPDRVMPS